MKRHFTIALLILSIALSLASICYAKDVAYIYRNSNAVDPNFISAFSDLGYNTTLIMEDNLPSDLSNYSFIFLDDEVYKTNLPIGMYPFVISNRRNGIAFGIVNANGVSSLESTKPLQVDYNGLRVSVYTSGYSPINTGIHYYYLKNTNKANNFTSIASTPIDLYGSSFDGDVVSYMAASSTLINNKVIKAPICFYGLVSSKYWTNVSKTILSDCISSIVCNGAACNPQVNNTNNTNPTNITIECNDGLDNDNDGLIDMDDPGCCTSLSNNESSICYIDNASPRIIILSPKEKTYYGSSILLDYQIVSSNISNCWYTIDDNMSVNLPNCVSVNITNLTEQNHSLTLYANDTNGKVNSSRVNFMVSYFEISNLTTDLIDKNILLGQSKNISINFDSTNYPVVATITLYSTSSQSIISKINNTIDNKTNLPIIYNIPGTLLNGSYVLNFTGKNMIGQTIDLFLDSFMVVLNGSNASNDNGVINTGEVTGGGAVGGGGGGHIAKSKTCTPSWNCTEWSKCSNSYQKRTCIDANNCHLESPITRQLCSVQVALDSDNSLASAVTSKLDLMAGNITLKDSAANQTDSYAHETELSKSVDKKSSSSGGMKSISGLLVFGTGNATCSFHGYNLGSFFHICWQVYLLVYIVLLLSIAVIIRRSW